jgi:hypothetical protein
VHGYDALARFIYLKIVAICYSAFVIIWLCNDRLLMHSLINVSNLDADLESTLQSLTWALILLLFDWLLDLQMFFSP